MKCWVECDNRWKGGVKREKTGTASIQMSVQEGRKR